MDNRFREVNHLVVKHTKWSLFQKKNREERERERERWNRRFQWLVIKTKFEGSRIEKSKAEQG